MDAYRVLVGSPVCQKPEILAQFLLSLQGLNNSGITMDYIFVDDNKEAASSQRLAAFKREESSVIILPGKEHSTYVCDSESHHWDDSLMLRVANFKNTIIQYAIAHSYDALFFVDSDLVLHPDIVLHLIKTKKDIVSEIFWSQWHEGLDLEPNVWMFDEYDLVPKEYAEILSVQQERQRRNAFLQMLHKPGIYEVGGLGACTLLLKAALIKGVSFAPVKNLTIHGEDRFFCIRAAVLNIPLFVDTYYPAYHIYRESDLAGVAEYACASKEKSITGRVTLSMIVKNEEKRYLSRMLTGLVGHIDDAVIIDDASSDRTVEICEQILKDIPLRIIRNKQSMFANEVGLRKMQWEETIKANPDWILSLDADELIEEDFWISSQKILFNRNIEQCEFRLYDMWNETQYREDAFWSAHKVRRTFLLRYRENAAYKWNETPQHCGRFPLLSESSAKAEPAYRVQHFGWATQEDREEKMKRYRLLDPNAIYGIREQYDCALSGAPTLIDWQIHE